MTGNEAIFPSSPSHPQLTNGKRRTKQRRRKLWFMVKSRFWLSQSCASLKSKLKMKKLKRKQQSDQMGIKTDTDQNFFSAISVN